MGVRKTIATLAAAAIAVAAGIAILRVVGAAREQAALVAAREERSALLGRIAGVENQIAAARRRHEEVARDRDQLSKAIAAVRASKSGVVVASGALADLRRAPAVPRPASASQNSGDASAAAVVFPGPPRPGTTHFAPITGGSEAEITEQLLLRQERAYQQALAFRRQDEAKYRAYVEQQAFQIHPERGLDILLTAAEEQTAKGEFQMALRLLEGAARAVPSGQSLPARAVRLQGALALQKEPADVELQSDGQTFVSIVGALGPVRFASRTAKILPGNYEVVGRRPGYADVVVPLEVRGGRPVPTVAVVCTTPLPSGSP